MTTELTWSRLNGGWVTETPIGRLSCIPHFKRRGHWIARHKGIALSAAIHPELKAAQGEAQAYYDSRRPAS